MRENYLLVESDKKRNSAIYTAARSDVRRTALGEAFIAVDIR